MMHELAKVGMNQSYTYFTWRNARWEIEAYVTELANEDADYFRPNFFANTPDILSPYLVEGGRPAFEARLVLAATLSPSYGIYSGYEHFENVPVREGSEEYLDSEKYETKKRKLDGPLLPLVKRLNTIRRENAALQRLDNVDFLETENEQLIAFAKRAGGNVLLVCVNLDARAEHEGVLTVPVWLGLPPAYSATELLTDLEFHWRIGRNYVRLGPGQAHVMEVQQP
jgi:starch synthase (maltosyl-transferring)